MKNIDRRKARAGDWGLVLGVGLPLPTATANWEQITLFH